LHVAAACGYAALAMRLIAQGAPLHLLDGAGNDALSLAAGGAAVEAIALRVRVRFRANPNPS